jgi:murein DD-endopeptidase MepM/ murein hydrolase activator NlpD
LSGGAYIGLVAARIGAREIPVEISVTLTDGTRLVQSLWLLVGERSFPATRLSVATRFTAPDQQTLKRIERERQLVRSILRSATDEPLWRGPFELPLEGVTTSPFGQRRLFNNELRSRHTGHDIDGDTGDPVYASNSGRVAISRDLFFNGGAVFIDHGLGLYTGYFHLSKREVMEGEWVEKGQLLGLVGATGRVTGPHLHWSIYLNGASLDPLSLFQPGLGELSARLFPPAGAPTPIN